MREKFFNPERSEKRSESGQFNPESLTARINRTRNAIKGAEMLEKMSKEVSAAADLGVKIEKILDYSEKHPAETEKDKLRSMLIEQLEEYAKNKDTTFDRPELWEGVGLAYDAIIDKERDEDIEKFNKGIGIEK